MELFIPLVSAFWLGVATSIAPCPLATNIAAVMFVTRDIKSPAKTLVSGVAYAMGRALLYMLLGFLVGVSVLSMPAVSRWLQDHMIKILGPVLIVTGLFVLDWIQLRGWSNERLENIGRVVADKGGVLGSFGLGVIFAMAFCPITAAIFVGSLLPLELESKSYIAVPLAYGIGSALPVLLFAFASAFFAKSFNKLTSRASSFGRWVKMTAGAAILIIGLYFSIFYVWIL